MAREQLALFEDLRLPAVALAVEPQLALEALLVALANEGPERLAGFADPRQRRRLLPCVERDLVSHRALEPRPAWFSRIVGTATDTALGRRQLCFGEHVRQHRIP